jgi:hypothetical protein
LLRGGECDGEDKARGEGDAAYDASGKKGCHATSLLPQELKV